MSGGLDVRDLAVICGPTAAGKSAIAMTIAERSGASIISADSRQVYRGFDLGTAKPCPSDRQRVRHHGIDVIAPTERYSAAQWCAAAAGWIEEESRSARPVVIVGGTGFYLRALETPLFESPPLDPVRRLAVLAELEGESTETLRRRCEVVDAGRSHLGRTQLLRALEVHALTGRPLSEWMLERAPPAAYRMHYLLVDPGPVLQERIAGRVQAMIDAGWEQEVAGLATSVPADAPAWNACGYDLLRASYLGQMDRHDAIDRTVIATRQYAKRQRTWFRHQLPADRVTRLDPTADGAATLASNWLQSTFALEQR